MTRTKSTTTKVPKVQPGIVEATLLRRQKTILRRISVLHGLLADRVAFEDELRTRTAELREIDEALQAVQP